MHVHKRHKLHLKNENKYSTYLFSPALLSDVRNEERNFMKNGKQREKCANDAVIIKLCKKNWRIVQRDFFKQQQHFHLPFSMKI